jgi:phosphopantetheinyl transferase (holo-ACP synthase)
MRAEVHVSLTDEPPMAQAIVIIETVVVDGAKVA